MRFALFLLALMSGPVYAQGAQVDMLDFNQRPTPESVPEIRERIGPNGVTNITQERPRVIHICGTSPATVVIANGRQLTIQNGRVCGRDEKPDLTLDTLSCSVITGVFYGSTSMSCSRSN